MKQPEELSSYRVYVLRSWHECYPCSETPSVWRFSLEDPATRQRRGFADLESLMRFLAAETIGSNRTKSGNNDQAGQEIAMDRSDGSEGYR
jgi:hypothetical protein